MGPNAIVSHVFHVLVVQNAEGVVNVVVDATWRQFFRHVIGVVYSTVADFDKNNGSHRQTFQVIGAAETCKIYYTF